MDYNRLQERIRRLVDDLFEDDRITTVLVESIIDVVKQAEGGSYK